MLLHSKVCVNVIIITFRHDSFWILKSNAWMWNVHRHSSTTDLSKFYALHSIEWWTQAYIYTILHTLLCTRKLSLLVYLFIRKTSKTHTFSQSKHSWQIYHHHGMYELWVHIKGLVDLICTSDRYHIRSDCIELTCQNFANLCIHI